MSRLAKNGSPSISARFVRTVCDRVASGKRVRRKLPSLGRIHMDRPLPFLCVYRCTARERASQTDRLVASQPSYVVASSDRKLGPGLASLVGAVGGVLVEQFGACLILEIWPASGQPPEEEGQGRVSTPRFRIFASPHGYPDAIVDAFADALARIRIARRSAEVQVARGSRWGRPGLASIGTARALASAGCSVLGLEVGPIWRNRDTGEVYPPVLLELRRKLSAPMRRLFFDFARAKTTHHPRHYHMLGRRAVVKAVWGVDRRLAEVSESFDFLLQVTPVDAERAWRQFEKSRFTRRPTFHYRPLPLGPALLKRRLFAAPIERIEDPTLALLFRQKQDELDRQITMLADIGKPSFLHGSVQVYGSVDDDLLALARGLLERLPSRPRGEAAKDCLDAEQLARRAREELAHYLGKDAVAAGDVQVRPDMHTGLMVSQGSLLIGHRARVPTERVEALLQHEIGVHVVTYRNALAQPFQQLHTGLAGYEALQEGLAVLAEYLAGGLSRPRLRLLAARVVAVRRMLDGASFVDVFRELSRTWGFDRKAAFSVAMRVFRGGGLTKDALYLDGLRQVLDYLGRGNEIAPLLIGKVGAEHLPLMRELRWRGVLREPPLTPRFMTMPGAVDRLARVANGISVYDLLEGRKR